MKALDPRRLGAILAEVSQPLTTDEYVAATSSQLIQAKLSKTKVSCDEVAKLSDEFLSERRTAIRNILGENAFFLEGTGFAFLPVPESFAFVYVTDDDAAILLSLGLVEVLRLACVAGLLESASQRLQADRSVQAAFGATAWEKVNAEIQTMIRYFHACSLLHFHEPGELPNAIVALDPKTLHKAEITLQAVLMFVILHEMGHVMFRKLHRPIKPGIVWEFAIPEELDARKEEELYADNYALFSVPEAFRLPLVHAATFFLHLNNFVDLSKTGWPTTHPLPVNRTAAMYAHAKVYANGDEIGHLAVNNALAIGAKIWQESELKDSGVSVNLATLKKFVGLFKDHDWRPMLESLLLVTSAD